MVTCLQLLSSRSTHLVRTHSATLAEELNGIGVGGGGRRADCFLVSAVLPGCPGKSPGNAAFASFLSMLSWGLLILKLVLPQTATCSIYMGSQASSGKPLDM